MFDEEEDEHAALIPPENFCMVLPHVYRSGYPVKKNFPFLRRLRLKTILYLCPEEYPPANLSFLSSIHARLLQFGVQGNKEPFIDLPVDLMSCATVAVFDKRNWPLLIHCNKGKHRTGCLVGCVRKMLGWSLAGIFEEYRRFAYPKERFMDEQFLELFQMDLRNEYLKNFILTQIQDNTLEQLALPKNWKEKILQEWQTNLNKMQTTPTNTAAHTNTAIAAATTIIRGKSEQRNEPDNKNQISTTGSANTPIEMLNGIAHANSSSSTSFSSSAFASTLLSAPLENVNTQSPPLLAHTPPATAITPMPTTINTVQI